MPGVGTLTAMVFLTALGRAGAFCQSPSTARLLGAGTRGLRIGHARRSQGTHHAARFGPRAARPLPGSLGRDPLLQRIEGDLRENPPRHVQANQDRDCGAHEKARHCHVAHGSLPGGDHAPRRDQPWQRFWGGSCGECCLGSSNSRGLKIKGGSHNSRATAERESDSLGDAVPQTPWDLSLWRQDRSGRGRLSHPPFDSARSRRSGCFLAEPYPPVRLKFIPLARVPCNPPANHRRASVEEACLQERKSTGWPNRDSNRTRRA